MPPPSRANTFGPTMHTQSPFTTQHLVHGAHGAHAPHHLAHHQLQPQHHGLTAQQQQSHHQQQQQQQQHQQPPQPQHQNPHPHALQQAQQAHAQAQAMQSAAQQQQAVAQATSALAAASTIKDVWKSNLESEMAVLRELVDKYPYIAMDTEFPGIVARPIGQFKSKADYHYQTLRCNVDLLKMIQLGLTFYDDNGKSPEPISTWQFHFQFSLSEDMYAQDSIDLLTKSGIDFKRHEDFGISVAHFGELLVSSGLVLLDNVKWLSFHSGYDFGYLVKLMTCKPLPNEETEFRRYIDTFFPSLYDIKYIMRSCKNLKGGLQDVADEMGIPRIGPQHQAGSDSLLTGHVFFAMRQRYFDGKIDDEKFMGQVWGLNGIGVNNINPNVVNTVGAVHYNANGQPNGGPQPPSTPTGTNSTLAPAPITPQGQSGQAQQSQSQQGQQSQQQSQPQMNPYAQGGMGMGNIGMGGMNSSAAFAFGKMGGI